MANNNQYDVIVIGSGSSGFSAAVAARKTGAEVCLIEKGKLGGECPNFACIPSKSLLKTAKVYKNAQKSRRFGVHTGEVRYDFLEMMDYKDRVVEAVTGGGERGKRYVRMVENRGIDLKLGTATFVDAHTVEVNGDAVEGKAIVIATGTVDFVPPIEGLDEIDYLGWKDVNFMKEQPESLAIIGGGPVGSEMATFFNAIGTKTFMFQAAETILNHEDPEIAQMAHDTMADHGVEVYGNAMVQSVEPVKNGARLHVDIGDKKDQTFIVEKVLVATGKRSNVDGLKLDDAGVTLTDRGVVETNTEQRTNVKHIYAAGDVDGGLRFTHTAHYEGTIAGHNAAMTAMDKGRGAFERADERVVPRATFVDPEVASVGMTEAQVKDKHGSALVGTAKIGSLGRSVTEQTRTGMVKVVGHPENGQVLGGHIMAERAGEMIHELALAMHLRATVEKVGDMIHAFPTYSEAIAAAAATADIED